jgi:hypothetical protein
MVAYGALLLTLRRRSESLALLSGDAMDERQAQVLVRANAAMGLVLVTALAVGSLVTLAMGSSYAEVLCGLSALGGISFVIATVWFARHT